ncbi:MAG: SLBB domain-containing protein [Longimicrobiales bacterium]|nr:SLBB domain-containing protein [Longimicrobiales bacterium]
MTHARPSRFRTAEGFLVGALVALSLLSGGPAASSLAAQVNPRGVNLQELAGSLSQEEILRRIQASGLTRAQARDRLRRAGYNPALADPYYDALESGGVVEGAAVADARLLEALQGIGVTLREDSVSLDRQRLDARGDSLLLLGDSLLEPAEPDTIPRVFGTRIFRRASTQFDPILTGPVGPNYVLGPGDEILLVLTGDVELAYTLDVTREGYVIIPQVGQVSVNGLTLEGLQDRLAARLGQVYSGVTGTPDATTRFDVSLGRLRTNQVRVAGFVERPGSYQISSVGTLLEGLYLAGGPTDQGSFRRVLVQRRGEAPIEVDLYPYLTTGTVENDPRLMEGDVVFVPAAGPQVTLAGMVRNPAIFELREGEALPALVRFAGGLLPDARTDRAQVDRVLAPADRSAGVDRVLLDAPLADVLAGADGFPLQGGDRVEVFPVLERTRQRVGIHGAVWRPGSYELRPGTTVGSLVERAGGLVDAALGADILVDRLDLTTGDRLALRADLVNAPPGPLLREFDEVMVFPRDSLTAPDSVAVYGLVQNPGRYPLSEGLTAGDLVLLAGGFRKGAVPWSAEVVTPVPVPGPGQALGESRIVALRPSLPYPDPEVLSQRPDSANAFTPESGLPLRDRDEVYVRLLPGYVTPERVAVEGEVVSPGPYQLLRQDERLSSLMLRAGGLTQAAFPEGLRLVRDGVPVGVNYQDMMAAPGSEADPVLVGGDRVVMPVMDNTVLITGAVLFDSRVVYRDGMGLDDFLDQAGGVTPDGDKGRVTVEYANGSRAGMRRRLLFFHSTPEVRPGSRIIVPEKPPAGEGFDWDAALSRILAVTSTLATVYIAVNR